MRVTTSSVTDDTVGFDGLRAVVGAGDGVVGRFPGIVCVARCPDPDLLREFLAVCGAAAGPEPGRALARRLATWMSGPDAPGPQLRFGTIAAAGDRIALYLVGEVDARVDTIGGLTLSGAHAAIGTDRLLPHPAAPVVLSLDGGAVRADPADVHDLRAGIVPGAGVVLRPTGFERDDLRHAEAAGGHEWFDTGEGPSDPLGGPSRATDVPAQRAAGTAVGGRNGVARTTGSEAIAEAEEPEPGGSGGPATGAAELPNGHSAGRHALDAPVGPPTGAPLSDPLSDPLDGDPLADPWATAPADHALGNGTAAPPPGRDRDLGDLGRARAAEPSSGASLFAPAGGQVPGDRADGVPGAPAADGLPPPPDRAPDPTRPPSLSPPQRSTPRAAAPAARAGLPPGGAGSSPGSVKPAPTAGRPSGAATSPDRARLPFGVAESSSASVSVPSDAPPDAVPSGAEPPSDGSTAAIGGSATSPGILFRPHDDIPPEPLPPAAELDAVPNPRRGPRIRGYRCENGHLNDPRSPSCRACRAPIDERAGGLVAGPRPALGRLVFDDGAAHVVDGGYLVGRMPDADDRVRTGELRPIVVDDEAGSVSRTHAEIRVSGWDVMVVDIGSRNAVYVSGPDEGQWTPLPPRRSRRLLPGTRVRLGGRMFVFESSSTVR